MWPKKVVPKTRNQKKVVKLIKIYRDKFGLRKTVIKIKFSKGKLDNDIYAEVVMKGRVAKIHFNEDLMDKRPEEIENTVVHELLHIVLYKLTDRASWIIQSYVRLRYAREILEDKISNLEHEAIERLIRALTK